jgi:acetamidase/formamidase
MAHHILTPTTYHNVLGTLPAALTVASGDTVTTETIDANGWDKHGKKVWTGPNPMNGPIAVAGAEPGDSLRVDILAMQPIRPTGWTRAALAENVVDPDFVTALPPRDRAIWAIDGNAGTVTLQDPPAGFALTLPMAPMIGCLGVAPAMGQAISTATSGEYGGNMDYRRLGPGATIWFPVSTPGALFFLGDAHALQGDGEIVGTGIEHLAARDSGQVVVARHAGTVLSVSGDTIIVEQNAIAALHLSDRALNLDMGEIVFDGTAKDVIDNAELRQQYLAI